MKARYPVASTASTSFAAEIIDRIEVLGAISEADGMLTRRYLTAEHRRANDAVRGWMEAAGMAVREDAVGNIIGRYEGAEPGAAALMVGSHVDTVIDGGKYDGTLGVLSGIACVAAFNEAGQRFPFAIEVVGFGDEDGARFQSTFLGSRAIAGTFDHTILTRLDGDGISVAEAMAAFGLDTGAIDGAAYGRENVLAYLELHIEQGPVLEQQGLAVGVVTAIAGATRLSVTVTGEAGHAGTVPMALRRDALAAASECVLAVELAASSGTDMVGTVGKLAVEPGALNVVPGRVSFTIDFRAARDDDRNAGLAALRDTIDQIAVRRSVEIVTEVVHEAGSVQCASHLMAQISGAIEACGHPVLHLPSGAGHDAMAMADLTDVGMIFVRCKGGISHHPQESVTDKDAGDAAQVLCHVIENFALDEEA